MGMTLRQLLALQPPYIQHKAQDVPRLTVTLTTTKAGLPAAQGKVKSASSEKTYTCQVAAVAKPKGQAKTQVPKLQTHEVKVSCTCDFFKYYCEYALHQHQVANIRWSNGQPARSTNPDNFPLLCKHLYALGRKLL